VAGGEDESKTRTPTHGLIWARTRHATSRAGDPEPHDQVLIANAGRMADQGGGWKAVDTAALRDLLHAATATGRVASAAKAVSLGYAIEPDDGPSGRLGHWRIAGMSERACAAFSKRSAEITAAVESKGYATYQARQTATRDTRKAAGAGKTTAIDVVRDAFETAGYRVIGTSISGQAARTLGAEAQIAESRTTASLLWRLHGQLQLDRCAVVVLDEAGLADDWSVLRLLAAAETAGSKVIMVGDHRQLGAVGPGGSLEGLVCRHGEGVHILDENVRQVDPEERATLRELRAGSIEKAVDWYAHQQRIVAAPTRDGALDGMVAAWAADLECGLAATMLAWRRANVVALNERARVAMADSGGLSGPELVVDGHGYRAGDRIVTLAPGTHGDTVTSQRGIVTTVDLDAGSLLARMDDGQVHRLGPDDTRPDRLAHGYATTVHRSQGATVDHTHLFADGGGRELGYVAMSRARHSSHVHLVADSHDQAVEDVIRDWSTERRQRWAIDTGRPEAPATGPIAVEADPGAPLQLRATLGRGRLTAERDALLATLRAEPPTEPQAALQRLKHLDGHIRRLNGRLDPQPPAPRAVGYPEGAEVSRPAATDRVVTADV
jgi:hypothetical protein